MEKSVETNINDSFERVKKIVIIGPESTGKSSLCAALAKHYQTLWCPEYARNYLLENGKQYDAKDLEKIAIGQNALEAAYTLKVKNLPPSSPTTPKLLFFDTDNYVLKVWNEYVFNTCPYAILEDIVVAKVDLYLLCKNDIPWTKDELREYPDEYPRAELFQMYLDIVINQSTPWKLIYGDYPQRLKIAIDAIDKLL